MNVLLIGDSIRMFYQKDVQSMLGSGYNVYSPEVNCKFSAFILNSLRFWLEQFPAPDVIHFNAGLWDTAILYPEDGCFISKEEYVGYMKKVLRVLKSTGAAVIFATTTPVSDDKRNFPGPMPPAHRNEDIRAYNSAVLKAFEKENIMINDLFSLVWPDREKYLLEDKIHPNEAGVKLLAEEVSRVIRNCGAHKNTQEKSKSISEAPDIKAMHQEGK